MQSSLGSVTSSAEQLDQVLAIAGELLGELKVLAQARRRSDAHHASLSKQRRQTKKEQKEFDASFQSFLAEAARIGKEDSRIAAEVCPALVHRVWDLLPDLEIDHPSAVGFKQKYRDLLERMIPEDKNETPWVTDFLLSLAALLRDTRAAVSVSAIESENAGMRDVIKTPNDHPRSIRCPQAAERLLRFKNSSGLTNEELSERMGRRVSAKTIGKLLNHGMAVSSVLDEVAGTMGITKEELLKG